MAPPASPPELHQLVDPRTGEIAHRFVALVRNPDARQIAEAVQDRKLLRVAAVGLDALTRFAGNHRGGRPRCSRSRGR